MYNLLGATILSPIWSLISPVAKVDELPHYSWLMFLFIVATVAVSFIQQGTMAKSMQYNNVGMASILLYLALPIGYFLDWICFDRAFGGLELGGAGLICGANILISFLRVCGYIE